MGKRHYDKTVKKTSDIRATIEEWEEERNKRTGRNGK